MVVALSNQARAMSRGLVDFFKVRLSKASVMLEPV